MVSAVVNILLKSSGMAGRLLSLMEATPTPSPEGSGGGAGRQSEEKLSRLVGGQSRNMEIEFTHSEIKRSRNSLLEDLVNCQFKFSS